MKLLEHGFGFKPQLRNAQMGSIRATTILGGTHCLYNPGFGLELGICVPAGRDGRRLAGGQTLESERPAYVLGHLSHSSQQ